VRQLSSARCPQAFSRLQDSQSFHTINHYKNVTSRPARHVFSVRVHAHTISFSEHKGMPRAVATNEVSAQSTEVSTFSHLHLDTHVTMRLHKANISGLISPWFKYQHYIAWTTALHFSGSHVCNCLLSLIAYGTPSWAKIEPTLFYKGNTTKPERLLEPCFERSLVGGRGLTVSFRHAY